MTEPFEATIANWERPGEGDIEVVIRISPHTFHIHPRDLADAARTGGQAAVQDAIFTEARTYAVAAYHEIMEAAAAACRLPGLDVTGTMMYDLQVEQLEGKVGDLADQLDREQHEHTALEARLDELRRITDRLEIVSEEPAFLSRAAQATAREAADKPGIGWWHRDQDGRIRSCETEQIAADYVGGHYWYGTRLDAIEPLPYHDQLMQSDLEYREALRVLQEHGIAAVKANDPQGRAFVIAMASTGKGEE